MSRLFARIFSSSINICGNRSEMVRVDGFRWGNLARFAFDQSIKPVESRFIQKTRSSPSDLNLGILVFIRPIAPFLLAAHVPRGNDPKRRSANGEHHEQQPEGIRLAEDIVAGLILGMSVIVRNKQRRVEEDFLALGLRNAMLDKILLVIALIPLKFGAAKEDFVGIIHC
jgi:hypothetical protein